MNIQTQLDSIQTLIHDHFESCGKMFAKRFNLTFLSVVYDRDHLFVGFELGNSTDGQTYIVKDARSLKEVLDGTQNS